MTLQQISEQVRSLILEGELDDAANALVQFFDKEWMSRSDKEQLQLYNQALYQLSQLNELKHQIFAGIISNEDADLKRNKIRAVLLEISEDLKGFEAASKGTEPLAETQAVPSPKPSTKKRFPYFIVGLLSIFLLAWVIRQVACKPDVPTGCYIKTGMMTELVMEPKLFGSKIGTLPKFKTYQVLATVSYHHVDDILFFKVNDKNLGVGWVQEGLQLEYTSPECLRQKEDRPATGPSNPGNENPGTEPPPVVSEQQFTGCYIKTQMMTGLLKNPEVMGEPFMRLPQYEKYKVIEVKKKSWAGQPVYFFKIKHGEYMGWVRQEELEFTSPECLD